MDILYMLDDEDLAGMEHEDMAKLCNAISLDLQIEKENLSQQNQFYAN